MSDDQWGVLVDEGKINATGLGSAWWAEQATHMARGGVLTTLDLTAIVGGKQFMLCHTRDDAEFAARHIGEHTHPTVAKATTLAKARASIRTAHAKRDNHEHGCEYCRSETGATK